MRHENVIENHFRMYQSPQIERIGIVHGTGGMEKETRLFFDQKKNKKHQLGHRIITFTGK